MDFQKLLVKIVKILDDLKISYAVTGGYAISVWGRVRSTFDIDVVIEVFHLQIKSFYQALKKISRLSYVDENSMVAAIERESEFNFIHGESGIKIDFFIAGRDPSSKLELERRIPKKIKGQVVYFISPEDLILSKLRWYQTSQSERQLQDVESVVKIQKDKLDFNYLKKWAKVQSTYDVLKSVIKSPKER
jgi:hypothetical protein